MSILVQPSAAHAPDESACDGNALPAFRVWDAHVPHDRAEWLACWASWPKREIFAHPSYVALNLASGERGMCASIEMRGVTILYPFVLRDIRTVPAWEPTIGPAYDVTSPYGYAGAFAWTCDGHEAATLTEHIATVAAAFWSGFDRWAMAQPVVAEFVRFSLFPDELAPYPGAREERLRNVVRTLDLDDRAMWADFEHKVRKNVQKARRSGLTVAVDERGNRLDEFLAVYNDTMQRRRAAELYRFPRAYFERLTAELAGNFCFFHALAGDAVISSELVLMSANRVYSFLGGTRADAFTTRPNDLLKFEVIGWARSRGFSAYVLGGGPEPNDGIYRYKLSFAPHGAMPFTIGTRVLRPDLYARLVERRAALAGDSMPKIPRFPGYRM